MLIRRRLVLTRSPLQGTPVSNRSPRTLGATPGRCVCWVEPARACWVHPEWRGLVDARVTPSLLGQLATAHIRAEARCHGQRLSAPRRLRTKRRLPSLRRWPRAQRGLLARPPCVRLFRAPPPAAAP